MNCARSPRCWGERCEGANRWGDGSSPRREGTVEREGPAGGGRATARVPVGKTARHPGVRGPSSVKVRRGAGGRQPGCPSGRRLVTGREGTVEREGAAVGAGGGGVATPRVPPSEDGSSPRREGTVEREGAAGGGRATALVPRREDGS